MNNPRRQEQTGVHSYQVKCQGLVFKDLQVQYSTPIALSWVLNSNVNKGGREKDASSITVSVHFEHKQDFYEDTHLAFLEAILYPTGSQPEYCSTVGCLEIPSRVPWNATQR